MKDKDIEARYSAARQIFADNLTMLMDHAKHLAKVHPESKERRRFARRSTAQGLN